MTGCEHDVRDGNSKFHLDRGIYALRLRHERFGRGCIEKEANLTFKRAFTGARHCDNDIDKFNVVVALSRASKRPFRRKSDSSGSDLFIVYPSENCRYQSS